jgi:D-glycero-D-manno-heptose 1,7-bisphosphate phosphatase
VLFLDRDGVVVEERNYLDDPADAVLIPGAAAAMARAREAGFALAGLSNQSGIGRGRFTEEQFARVMERVDDLLAAAGAGFDAFAYCPHAPEENCPCRKPGTGLLEELRPRLPWRKERSWLVGDKASDIACGLAAGLRSVHVATGHGGAEADAVRGRWGDEPRVLMASDLPEAVAAILAADGRAT